MMIVAVSAIILECKILFRLAFYSKFNFLKNFIKFSIKITLEIENLQSNLEFFTFPERH